MLSQSRGCGVEGLGAHDKCEGFKASGYRSRRVKVLELAALTNTDVSYYCMYQHRYETPNHVQSIEAGPLCFKARIPATLCTISRLSMQTLHSRGGWHLFKATAEAARGLASEAAKSVATIPPRDCGGLRVYLSHMREVSTAKESHLFLCVFLGGVPRNIFQNNCVRKACAGTDMIYWTRYAGDHLRMVFFNSPRNSKSVPVLQHHLKHSLALWDRGENHQSFLC